MIKHKDLSTHNSQSEEDGGPGLELYVCAQCGSLGRHGFSVPTPQAELTFDRFECAIAYFAQNFCQCDTYVVAYGLTAETRLLNCSTCDEQRASERKTRVA
jgi:hypothetical protein